MYNHNHVNSNEGLHISYEGCPSILRTDAGTENSMLSVIQPIFRHNNTDEFAQERSFRYGRSTSNQVDHSFY